MTQHRTRFTLTSEPAGRVYRSLLVAMGGVSEFVGVVIRPGMPISARGEQALTSLRSLAVEEADTTEWPGAQLLRGSARVVKLPATPGSIELLVRLSDSLYSWQLPDLPEDLFFLRRDNSMVLGTVAHERDGFLELSDFEETQITEAIPDLPSILRLD